MLEIQFLVGRRPMRSYSSWALATMLPYGSGRLFIAVNVGHVEHLNTVFNMTIIYCNDRG